VVEDRSAILYCCVGAKHAKINENDNVMAGKTLLKHNIKD
jgi:hypothetical protein